VCLARLAAPVAVPARGQDAQPSPAPSPSPSPGTRAEEWQRLREEKQKHLEPYRPTFLERQILAFEKAERPSLLDLNVKGFYPRIRSLSSGSRLAPVLHFWQPDIEGSRVSVHSSAAYSIAGYELYDFQAGWLPHRGRQLPPRSTKGDDVYELGSLPKPSADQLILYTSLRYRHDTEDAFFGLGPDSRLEDETSYLYQDASYELVAGWQFNRRLVATARIGYLQAFTTDGENDEVPPIGGLFDDRSAPGLAAQPDFFKMSGLFLFDGRDRPFNPHRGGMVALAFTRFDDRGGDAYRFDRVAMDLRGYVSLGSPQRVLAARFLASHDSPVGDARVPFYLQEPLSNSHDLRGYPTFRFRGEKQLTMQVEYRWEAAPAIELALFADGGRVFRTDEDWSLDDLRGAVGFGLRFKTHDDVLARLDLARGEEGMRVYLRFGPAF
jgi:hypothetical protein